MSGDTRVLAARYRVDELIGRGGMASVYRGYDETLGRTVAIKILDKELAADNAFRTRFRMEAQAASRMAHPSIVRVFDAGEDTVVDGGSTRHIPYIVMELVEGRLLKSFIHEGGVSTEDAIKYTSGILDALTYSHRAGVVHRDIKPGNVMVTNNGDVKVMDFGIARAVSDSSSTVAETTSIIGTAAYFSPEQAKGEPVDARTDLYSAGIVLYELLTGQQPFRGDSPVAVAYQHVSETPVAPSEVNSSVPRALDAVVLRALAKDPFARFPDATTFSTALADTREGKAPSKGQLDGLTSELYGANPRQAAETARSLRQLTTDTTMARTQQGPPVAWIWAGVVLVAILMISVLIWVISMRQTDTTIPVSGIAVEDVSSMTYDKAAEILEEQGLVPVEATESSETVASDLVIRTSPEAGTSLSSGQEVTVFVSSGKQLTTVPSIIGQQEADVTTALEQAQLARGAVQRVNDPNTEAGVVLDASAAEGDEVPFGTSIDLTVATGNVQIVDYTGFAVETARAELEADDMGLTVTVTDDPSCTGSAGTVSGQSLAPGDVPIKSTIELRTCTGG